MKSQKSQNMTLSVSTTNEKNVGSIMENMAVGSILLAGGVVASITTEFIFAGAIVVGAIILTKSLIAKSGN